GSSYVNLTPGQTTALLVGFYDTETTIEDGAEAVLTALWGDPTLSPNVAGGSEQTSGGGAADSTKEFRVYTHATDDGVQWGLYFELVNGTDYTIMIADVPSIADGITSAQTTVQVDGVGVLTGVDGAEVESDITGYLAATSGTDAATATAPETYVIPSGNITVTWTNGWTVVSQNEDGIELTDPDKIGILAIGGYANDGKSWKELSEADIAWLADDQGANASLTGPMVTEKGYSFATEGEYGLRLAQATASTDPAIYIFTFSHSMTVNGAEAAAWLKAAQAAVTIDGAVPLKDLDKFIDMSAS
ncbi:MAG: hypothetical protein ACTHMX_08815, partial [Thermomicrobiales bacterium]